MKVRITNRERAAILMLAFGLVDDWTEAYMIGADFPRKHVENLKYLAPTVSRWKNLQATQECFEQYKNMIEELKADERIKGRDDERRRQEEKNDDERREENNTGESIRSDKQPPKKVASVDYSDPENRKRLYNELIAKAADDPKTQLDAAKMFEQIQKEDKQAAREQKQVRFYLAQRCSECPLYEKARQKAEKG